MFALLTAQYVLAPHLLITEDSEGATRDLTLTFGELYAAGQRVAAELARRGVPAGGRVAMMLPTSRAFFVSYAGILLAGAIPVPIYPPFRADRIEEYAARQAAILNNAIAPLLRGRVTEYRFSAYNPGKTSNSWQIAGERSLLQS